MQKTNWSFSVDVLTSRVEESIRPFTADHDGRNNSEELGIGIALKI